MEQNKTLNEIFALLRQNDKTGLEMFYNLYYNKVFGIAFSVVKNETAAEDVVHNVIYKFMTMDSKLFPTGNEDTWLFCVVKNESLSLLRKERNNVSIDKIAEIGLEDKNINDYVDMEEFMSIIKPLSAERQEIVSLKILGGYTHNEIAKLLNKPIGTIQWLYNTSVKKLKVILSSLFSCILFFFCAAIPRGIQYIQNIFKSSNKPGGAKGFYIDYFLLSLILLIFISTILFFVIYKKNHKNPTKTNRKNI